MVGTVNKTKTWLGSPLLPPLLKCRYHTPCACGSELISSCLQKSCRSMAVGLQTKRERGIAGATQASLSRIATSSVGPLTTPFPAPKLVKSCPLTQKIVHRQNYSKTLLLEKLQISCKTPSLLEILRVHNPSRATKNNCQPGNHFRSDFVLEAMVSMPESFNMCCAMANYFLSGFQGMLRCPLFREHRTHCDSQVANQFTSNLHMQPFFSAGT